MLGDPKFPSSTSQRTDRANLSFFEDLFGMYMRLNLTQPTDRAIAFSGLEKRLAEALYTKIRYGIIERFLHRSLLWQRGGEAPLKRTVPTDRSRKKNPSWSWMAYDGEIEFMDIEGEAVDWSQAVQFPNEDLLDCRVREFKECTIERKGELFVVIDTANGVEGVAPNDSDDDKIKGWLKFDVDSSDIKTLKCVVIGRDTTWNHSSEDFRGECYVIVVKPRRGGKYNRVGVGSLHHTLISLEGAGSLERIV